jgi:hypothetical protein
MLYQKMLGGVWSVATLGMLESGEPGQNFGGNFINQTSE